MHEMHAGSRSLLLPCHIAVAIIVVLLSVTLVGRAAWSEETPKESIEYTVSVKGVKSSKLEKSIIDATQLLDSARQPVLTLRALRRRVEASRPRITALLRANGYYAANHEFRIDRDGDKAAEVKIEIVLGPVYRIGRYDILTSPMGEPLQAFDGPIETLGLKPGDRARSEVVSGADDRLLAALGRKGYPLARIDNRRVVVDHKTHLMNVEISVSPGTRARFGKTRIEGLEDVDRAFIDQYVDWKRGALFDSELLEKLRNKLHQTGLFLSVLVHHAEEVDSQGEIDIIVEVKERKHRSIGAGASYSTSDGFLGKLFWEHRNLFGEGERLHLRGEVGEIRQGAFGDLRFSDFGARDQDLVFDARATKEQPDGFTSVETATSVRMERRFSPIYAGSAGIGFDRSNVEENASDETFTYLTFPLSFRRDTSDDLLDPGTGGRTTLSFTPNVGIVDTGTTFYTARLSDTVYFSLLEEKKLVLAGWGRVGAIFGESTLDIPANKRLYAGGAGSIRGYGRNSIGPLDVQNDPVGGRSSTEFGVELRWRVYGPFGVASFVEAGGIYDDTMPDWGRHLQWGAGAGVRYLTKIGPLRLDVAVPLNRRNSVDDAFQILVSLGQAF